MIQKMHEIFNDEISDKNLNSLGFPHDSTPFENLESNSKNQSTHSYGTEEKIQRFEDLNRLAFFKSYLDHVKSSA